MTAPVGLLGEARMMSLVRGVMAASSFAWGNCREASACTRTSVAPMAVAFTSYIKNDGVANRHSSPSSR